MNSIQDCYWSIVLGCLNTKMLHKKSTKCKCSLLVGLTYLLCLLAFVANVVWTLTDYFSGETIMATKDVKIEIDQIPEVVVCNGKPFRDAQLPMFTIQEYKSNTYDPSELINDVTTNYKNVTASEQLFTHPWGWCSLYSLELEEVLLYCHPIYIF